MGVTAAILSAAAVGGMAAGMMAPKMGTPPAAPPTTGVTSAAATDVATSARKRQMELAAAFGGRSSTILTGGLGTLGPSSSQPQTLLGM